MVRIALRNRFGSERDRLQGLTIASETRLLYLTDPIRKVELHETDEGWYLILHYQQNGLAPERILFRRYEDAVQEWFRVAQALEAIALAGSAPSEPPRESRRAGFLQRSLAAIRAVARRWLRKRV